MLNPKGSDNFTFFLLVLFLFGQSISSNSQSKSNEQKENRNDSSLLNDSILINNNVKFSTEIFKLDLEEPAVGVQFYRNGIIYLLDTKKFYKKVGASFGILDTYYSQLKNKNLGRPSYFTSKFAFPYPTESVTFTSDYSTIFFTKKSQLYNSENENIKIFEGRYKTAIKLNNSDWSEKFVELPFNRDNYSCVEPSISGDGKTMIFASDMPGGYGKFDLYIVRKLDDEWTDPINLGSRVNTPGNENYPSFIEPSTIYFASDGHIGYGNFDIYFTTFQNNNWSEAINLGEPINSSGSDIAFTVSKEDPGMAFFSTNRNLYKNRYQLYLAILKSGMPFLTGDVISDSQEEFKEIVVEKKDNEVDAIVIEPVSVDEMKTLPEEVQGDIIEFRIQISSSQKSLAKSIKKVNGENYTVGEYYYKGAYRQTLGNFNDFSKASKFQKNCRASGYNGAFVVAFKNNERTLDKSVFIQKPPMATLTKPKAPVKKVNTIEKTTTSKSASDNQINYRIQVLSSGTSKGQFNISIDGKEYPTFEYYYKGAYRYTIGKYYTVKEALNMHSKCKNTKYNQAFIVKFKGGKRE